LKFEKNLTLAVESCCTAEGCPPRGSNLWATRSEGVKNSKASTKNKNFLILHKITWYGAKNRNKILFQTSGRT
jgi:hypothetical protein